jgi:hypothetical protein
MCRGNQYQKVLRGHHPELVFRTLGPGMFVTVLPNDTLMENDLHASVVPRESSIEEESNSSIKAGIFNIVSQANAKKQTTSTCTSDASSQKSTQPKTGGKKCGTMSAEVLPKSKRARESILASADKLSDFLLEALQEILPTLEVQSLLSLKRTIDSLVQALVCVPQDEITDHFNGWRRVAHKYCHRPVPVPVQ